VRGNKQTLGATISERHLLRELQALRPAVAHTMLSAGLHYGFAQTARSLTATISGVRRTSDVVDEVWFGAIWTRSGSRLGVDFRLSAKHYATPRQPPQADV
jgi:hypothetical protein